MTVSFTCHTHIGMEPGELFDLSRNVDAHVGSMAKSRERAVAGVVGRLAEKAFLGRYLQNLIEQRNEYLAGNGAAS